MSAIHDIAQGSHKGASLGANSDSAPTPCAGTGLSRCSFPRTLLYLQFMQGQREQPKSERLAIIMNVDVSGKSDTESGTG